MTIESFHKRVEVAASRDDRTRFSAGTVSRPAAAPPRAASVSIVIPAYNEDRRIGETLAAVMAYARSNPQVVEVIVVDDGSTDATAATVESRLAMYPAAKARLRLLRNPHHLGKGAAVRTGVLAADGDIVIFIDADLSSPISALPQLAGRIEGGQCHVAIASRALDRSLIEVRQSRCREAAGRLFNVLVRHATGLRLLDTQCGFKAYHRAAILPAFRMQRITDFAFDVEILYLARQLGLVIHEVPLPWSHVHQSKVRILRDSLRMFADVLRIRINHLRGAYRQRPGPAPQC